MRIALISPSTLPLQTGNSILAERLRAGLSARGHAVTLFNIATDDAATAAAFRPEIIHSLHATKPSAWLKKLFSKHTFPWVITLTGTDYNAEKENESSGGMLEESMDRAAALVVFHDAAYAALQLRFPGYAYKMHVNPQGIELLKHATTREAVREKHGLGRDDIVFLMASGIRPVKNIGYALEAFAEIEKKIPSARLVLAGAELDTHEASRIMKIGERLSRFVYLREQPYDEMRRLMFASDVFLNTSLQEGMSGAVLEAMAEGLPVIATLIPGNRVLVQEGVNGYLVSLEAPQQLIDAAWNLAENRTLRSDMGSFAKKRAAQYTAAQEIDGYERLYKKVLSTKYSVHGCLF